MTAPTTEWVTNIHAKSISVVGSAELLSNYNFGGRFIKCIVVENWKFGSSGRFVVCVVVVGGWWWLLNLHMNKIAKFIYFWCPLLGMLQFRISDNNFHSFCILRRWWDSKGTPAGLAIIIKINANSFNCKWNNIITLPLPLYLSSVDCWPLGDQLRNNLPTKKGCELNLIFKVKWKKED